MRALTLNGSGKGFRALGWALILTLAGTTLPSCTETEGVEPAETEVVAEGAPIDAAPAPLAAPPTQPAVTGPEATLASPSGAEVTQGTATTETAAKAGVDVAVATASAPPAPDAAASLSQGGPGLDVKNETPKLPEGAEKTFQPVSFAYLSSFEYDVPDPFTLKGMKPEEIAKLTDQIPDYIKRLNSKKIAVKGFMVPIDVEGEGVKSFILTYSQMMCCFGQMPWYNEWVYVEMADGQPASFYNDTPITVSGTLDVGEEIEDGFVISLYRMKAENVIADAAKGTPASNN